MARIRPPDRARLAEDLIVESGRMQRGTRTLWRCSTRSWPVRSCPGHSLDWVRCSSMSSLRHLEMPDRDANRGPEVPLPHLTATTGGRWTASSTGAEKHPERCRGTRSRHRRRPAPRRLAWCLTCLASICSRSRYQGPGRGVNQQRSSSRLRQWFDHFEGVDDPYVRERVMAAAYGVVMRSDRRPGPHPAR